MASALSAALRRAARRPTPPAVDGAAADTVYDGDVKRGRLYKRLQQCSSPDAMALYHCLDSAIVVDRDAFDIIVGDDSDDALYECYRNVAVTSMHSIPVPSYADRQHIIALGESLPEPRKRNDRATKEEVPTLAPALSDDEEDGLEWLYELCARLERFNADGSIVMQRKDLFAEIINIVSSSKSDDEIQMALFDLVGADAFDDIIAIMQRRPRLRQLVPHSAGAAPITAPHSMLSVTSDGTKALHRKQRQQHRKMMRLTRPDPNAAPSLPPVSDADDDAFLAMLRDSSFGSGSQRRVLGEDVTRQHFEGWLQVTIPAKVRTAAEEAAADLLSITAVDVWARPAFSDLTQFNRMQSRCLPPAYQSNQNLLICAPTGAGKTNVALLCILHEIKLHAGPLRTPSGHIPLGSLSADLFKVVYIAPMKALAQEIVGKLGRALRYLGVRVRELTGDMQLSRREIAQTHIIVTTPEKWDVITRKSNDLISLVRLLIFDEVHILHDTRGAVIEVLVARTIRQVESSQSMIRIVGLSATLPNYADVAAFLRVNPQTGLLAFDPSYRPVPLTQTFIGITHPNSVRRQALLNEICHEKMIEALQRGYQIMIFVHSRKDTVVTAQAMIELSQRNDTVHLLEAEVAGVAPLARDRLARVANRDLRYLATYGIGIHNAGMFRDDRAFVEQQFEKGALRVLVTTATLAWGVNLPAHTVIIKGTQVYSAQRGGYIDLSMLDVMQIFGRAGRPQYDDSGEGIIITQGDAALARYLRLLMQALPIESRLTETLVDNLNAEINLGTVANVTEAMRWISYTYLYIRLLRNPLHYGVSYQDLMQDPTLAGHRRSLIDTAVKRLIDCRMLQVPSQSEVFMPTDLGRSASFFYVSHASIEAYMRLIGPETCDDDVALRAVAVSVEFAQLRIRPEELDELEELRQTACPVSVAHIDTPQDKVNVLLQAYISRHRASLSSLVSDTNYIIQSAGRICRALYEITLKRGWAHVCLRFLALCKQVERRMWDWETPLRQFPAGSPGPTITDDLAYQIEQRNLTFSTIVSLRDDVDQLATLLPSTRQASLVLRAARSIPRLTLDYRIQPINTGVCKVTVHLAPDFTWNDRLHGSVQVFRLLAFESNAFDRVHHAEEVVLQRSDYDEGGIEVEFYVGVASASTLPDDLYASVDSDTWLGAETATLLSFDGVIIPPANFGHTALLDLHPLPVTALQNERFQRLYAFDQFNAVQTQCFHVLYHTDSNVLLGAPTGSGKTIVAEFAILKLLRDSPHKRVVYVAPLKALARERLIDWRLSLGNVLGLNVVEVTGDVMVSADTLRSAHVMVTTPEKFDGMSRRWRQRGDIRRIGLVIFDELHLLGGDRGPILEVIVSRLRYMSAVTGDEVRLVGLSTSLANADDVADWLHVAPLALYNFHPVVRPTPLAVHISGFPGSRHYCPRMEMLNKPTYASIMAYAPNKPTLVFVSSRRQTRLTALGLISFTVSDGNPHKFLHMPQEELEQALDSVTDDCLRHVLEFGIGLHHAGLGDHDRRLVESLFSSGRIQILVCTSTLAWGVNLPAHLCVLKGTEFYDARRHRYVDYPITDVIQMMGRAGRPQFRDTEAHACVLVHAPKKQFYKKFLFEPFPVESSLLPQLHDHINAEIQAGQLRGLRDALDYVSWTFLFRRLCKNPTYYGLHDADPATLRTFLVAHLRDILRDLATAGCVTLEDADADHVTGTDDGRLAAEFYLNYRTVALLRQRLQPDMSMEQVTHLLCECGEFAQVPVRHNEELVNAEMGRGLRWQSTLPATSPHLKAFLLLQALMQAAPLPITDYITDTKSVLDQSGRVLQAMFVMSASLRYAGTTLAIAHLKQCLAQRCTEDAEAVAMLPLPPPTLRWLQHQRNITLTEMVDAAHHNTLPKVLRGAPHLHAHLPPLRQYLSRYPALRVSFLTAGDQLHVTVDGEVMPSTGSKDADDSAQFWLGVVQGPTLVSWSRVPSRFPARLTLLLPPADSEHAAAAPLQLHLVAEQWRGLDQVLLLQQQPTA